MSMVGLLLLLTSLPLESLQLRLALALPGVLLLAAGVRGRGASLGPRRSRGGERVHLAAGEAGASGGEPSSTRASLGHQVNNLLTVIRGRAELLLESLPPDHPARAEAEALLEVGSWGGEGTLPPFRGAEQFVFPASAAAAPEEGVAVMVARLVAALDEELPAGVDLVLELRPRLPRVRVDPPSLEQILGNLVRNAGEAMPPDGGWIRVTLKGVEAPDGESGEGGGELVLEVEDSGSGMAPEVLDRAFEPFFSTRDHRRGAGLGLSTVQGLVRRMGGTVAAESRPGQGTRVRVQIPAESTPGREEDAASPLRTGTILLVEDEEVIRVLAQRILSRRGYRVLTAGGAEEALAAAEGAEPSVDLVLTDVVMRGVSGPELVARLRGRGVRAPVLYMSGLGEDHPDLEALRRQGVQLLQKPFDADALVHRVREAMAAAASRIPSPGGDLPPSGMPSYLPPSAPAPESPRS